jgi:hypothetical protein
MLTIREPYGVVKTTGTIPGRGGSSGMMISATFGGKSGRWVAGVFALCVSAAVVPASSAAPTGSNEAVRVALQERSAAESREATRGMLADEPARRFDDAPDGVDPMVTGPVSAAFKQRQEAARCDDAVWPNVPASCYPD